MNMTFRARILAAAIAALPLTADAAGLGRLSVMSALGQPLRAEVELSATREELSSLSARLAPPDAFKQAGIEYAPALSSLKFKVDRRPNGQPVLKISSDRPINDPYLDVVFELNWANGRLVREYTVLLDPADPGKPTEAVAPVAPVAPAVPSAAPPPPPASKPAPEAAPAAQPAARPKAAPAVRDSYNVRRGDTLSRIAGQTLPQGVSIEQMLVALYNRNQDAFDGNMNRLKAGRILSIPDREAAAAVSQTEARRIVSAQVADFNAYRSKLASAARAAPVAPAASQQAAGGKIAPKVEEKAPAVAPGQDQVEGFQDGDAERRQARSQAVAEDHPTRGRHRRQGESPQGGEFPGDRSAEECRGTQETGRAEEPESGGGAAAGRCSEKAPGRRKAGRAAKARRAAKGGRSAETCRAA